MSVPETWWRVILSDWYNSSAVVTLTIRGRVQFKGRLKRHPGTPGQDKECITLVTRDPSGLSEVQHDVDLTEVVAITAQATR